MCRVTQAQKPYDTALLKLARTLDMSHKKEEKKKHTLGAVRTQSLHNTILKAYSCPTCYIFLITHSSKFMGGNKFQCTLKYLTIFYLITIILIIFPRYFYVQFDINNQKCSSSSQPLSEIISHILSILH